VREGCSVLAPMHMHSLVVQCGCTHFLVSGHAIPSSWSLYVADTVQPGLIGPHLISLLIGIKVTLVFAPQPLQEETRRRRAQARSEDARSAGGLNKADPMRKMPSDGSGKKAVGKKH
jgi:hypothetical protein